MLVALACRPAHAMDFEREVRPIFQRSCLDCHGPKRQRSGYRLDRREVAFQGGDHGEPAIVPGKPDESPLWLALTAEDGLRMPPRSSSAPRLSAVEVGTIRAWIEAGAPWPEAPPEATGDDPQAGWAWRPIRRPTVPPSAQAHPIDAFLAASLDEKGLAMALAADRRTLIRRVSYDLTGLPPTTEEVQTFVTDERPDAYRRLVDRLLDSPRHGERWARHWLDVVHYGETHGYDKDQPRPNAWPYRDYVIRALNEDKPYPRFVQEQIAGDVLFPGTVDGIEALGFIAAGPWDLIGHMEVPESKTDGKIARHLDRDDMVSNTINTFCSVTVHCAQCHDHKFDPVPQEDYYALQAVFAALDRADKPYDADPAIGRLRAVLEARRTSGQAEIDRLDARIRQAGGPALADAESRLKAVEQAARQARPPEYGWHSAIAARPDELKWVQVDLGRSVDLDRVVLAPCFDDFNGIGAGFGFPVRYRVEASDDPTFRAGVRVIASREQADEPNPRIRPVILPADGIRGRWVRVTATRLAPRKDDYIVALAELLVLDTAGANLAKGAEVTSLDSIEAPVRWSRKNLTDGLYPAAGDEAVTAVRRDRERIVERTCSPELRSERDRAATRLDRVREEIGRLPAPGKVYAGTVYSGTGAFTGTGPTGGRPRPVAVLTRGDVRRPGKLAVPGALSCIRALPARFDLPVDAPEGERRAALARWLTSPDNPLIWRSIVNRVWQYHFGRGLVETPNDFGRMGSAPSHPELLDWLAAWFRDEAKGSLKALHRLIVTSAAYRQRSDVEDAKAQSVDADNRLLWRMNRRKLEAEAVRDSVLMAAGALRLEPMGGPSFRDFVIEHPEHSPHYQYQLADPEDPALHRRSVYRFVVRSQQQPWMAALDCADPSLLVDRRNQTITPLQALAQLNDALVIVMARHFAARVERAGGPREQVAAAYRIAFQRGPEPDELGTLAEHVERHGLASACRLILNLNEFDFVD
jgi:hypothetical protein